MFSVSLPDSVAASFEQLAKAEQRSKSELARDAIESYIDLRQWRLLQRESMRRAEIEGIGVADIEALVDELRAETKTE